MMSKKHAFERSNIMKLRILVTTYIISTFLIMFYKRIVQYKDIEETILYLLISILILIGIIVWNLNPKVENKLW